MLTLFALHLACAVHGFGGDLCVAVAVVESNLRVEAVSERGARGLMQVRPAVTPWPAWTLTTTVGGAMAGAGALRWWYDFAGPKRALRGYATGCTGSDGRKPCLRKNGTVNWPRVRAGERYDQRVMRSLWRLREVRREDREDDHGTAGAGLCAA